MEDRWTEKKKRILLNIAFYGIMGIAVLAVCKYIIPVMLPFIIAYLVAALLQNGIRRLGRSSRSKKLLAIILCTIFYLFAFFLLMFIGGEVLGGFGRLIEAAPGIYSKQIVPLLEIFSNRTEKTIAAVKPQLAQQLEIAFANFTQNIGSYISQLSLNLVKWVSQIFAGIPGFLIKLVITVVATFFITIDYDKIVAFARQMIPEERRESVIKGKDYVKNILWIYIRSYAFLFCVTFLELLAGFTILRIPYAGALSLAIAIFDILPVLGTGGILIPWAVVLIAMKEIPLAIGLPILYLVILIVRNMLEPKIVGKQIGLHPLATLISMFLGLSLIGVIGLIIFPVTLTVFFNLRLKKKMDEEKEGGQ